MPPVVAICRSRLDTILLFAYSQSVGVTNEGEEGHLYCFQDIVLYLLLQFVALSLNLSTLGGGLCDHLERAYKILPRVSSLIADMALS